MIEFDFSRDSNFNSLVLGIGVFDGVHLGHQKIIQQLKVMAEKNNAKAVAVTFLPHPRAVLCPDDPPALLISPMERIRRLKKSGADGIGIINFQPCFATLEPEEFLAQLCVMDFELKGICVGSKWRFGRFGRGDKDLLEKFAQSRNIDFCPVEEVEVEQTLVSSSLLRKLTAKGNLDSVKELTGFFPSLTGRVVHGYKDATNKLSAPTANLILSYGVIPPDGVYAGRCFVDGKELPCVLNIGFSPTFKRDGQARRIEVHLIGTSCDLYDKDLSVELVKFLRPEIQFNSVDELKKQIFQDISNAKEVLAIC